MGHYDLKLLSNCPGKDKIIPAYVCVCIGKKESVVKCWKLGDLGKGIKSSLYALAISL